MYQHDCLLFCNSHRVEFIEKKCRNMKSKATNVHVHFACAIVHTADTLKYYTNIPAQTHKNVISIHARLFTVATV